MLEASSFCAANIRDSDLVVIHNCTTPHDGFPVDLRSAATMNNVIASGVPHDCFCVDPNMSANTVMTTGTQIEWSAFLNYVYFDDVLEL